jgi:hypothetical protein
LKVFGGGREVLDATAASLSVDNLIGEFHCQPDNTSTTVPSFRTRVWRRNSLGSDREAGLVNCLSDHELTHFLCAS